MGETDPKRSFDKYRLTFDPLPLPTSFQGSLLHF